MDPVTHAASGAIAILSLSSRPKTYWCVPLSALVCASPDIDLAFAHTPLEFLLLHRGITHSLSFSPFFAVILALCCWPLWRNSTTDHWKFHHVWLFCIAMILLHDWLDIFTSYGTMIFLPFSAYRVRLNSLFIIDPFITIPLLWAIWKWRYKRKFLLAVFAWVFIYPITNEAIQAVHSMQCHDRFKIEGRDVRRSYVLPDVFAPFFWRVLFEQNDANVLTIREQGLNMLGKPRTPENIFNSVPQYLIDRLSIASTDCKVYFDFAILPVMNNLERKYFPEEVDPNGNISLLSFYDLRFGSDLAFARKIMSMRPNADIPFRLMTELTTDKDMQHSNKINVDKLSRVRLKFSDSGRDSQWHTPQPPQKPSLGQWLVGLQ